MSGSQERQDLFCSGLLVGGSLAVADNRLDQPVQLEAVQLAAGREKPTIAPSVSARASGSAAVVRNGSSSSSGWPVNRRSGIGSGAEEGGQLQQRHSCWAVLLEPVQRQGPGGIQLTLIAEHLAFGQ